MRIRFYHDYHKEAKTPHLRSYSNLTLTLTLTSSPSMKDYLVIFQKGVHIAQEFHLRGV